MSLYDKAKDVADDLGDKIEEVAGPALQKVRDVTAPVTDKLEEVAGPALSKVKEVAGDLGDRLSDVADSVKQLFTGSAGSPPAGDPQPSATDDAEDAAPESDASTS